MLVINALYLENVSFFGAKLSKKRKFANHTKQILFYLINTYQKTTKYLNVLKAFKSVSSVLLLLIYLLTLAHKKSTFYSALILII